jgi:PAS domain S-box-containing protein
MKVLIVEDNEDSRNLLAETVRAYGHEATATTNGAEALPQALAQSPDIIVSDILMPKMDGYQLCYEWKQNDKLKNIPFIFYTATYTSDEDEKFALSLGASAFIRKPAEPDAFVQILSEIFEKAKSGALAPPEVVHLEPSLYLTEYNKRLITKLDKKLAQLEMEITERKSAEERIQHLNLVLLRKVNQLIVRETDRENLLIGVCDNLTENRGYYNAWIALLDESGRFLTKAESGLGEDFSPMVKQLERGELPECGRQALKQAEVVAIEDPFSTCSDCPLATEYSGRGAMTIRLEHRGKVYGLLSASIPIEFIGDKEEQSLLQELAEDIAIALNNIELEEERKQAEESLRQDYNIINRSRVVAFLWKNEEGWPVEFVTENAKELFGYTAEEFTSGKVSYAEVVHPDDLNRVAGEVSNYSQDAGRERYEHKPYRIISKDGKEKWISDKTEIRRDDNDRITHYQGVVEDITELKLLETEKREYERKAHLSSRLASIGQMSAGIAHEINNPLTGVIGFADLLMERKDLPDDIRSDLEIIHKGARRVSEIVKRLLAFARRDKAERDYVSINEILETTIRLRAYEMETGNIKLKTYLDPDLPNTIAASGQLQQVFLNLIINAEDEMKQAYGKGNLSIRTERIDNNIRVSFKDDGPGIPKENLDRIFEPFFTTKKAGEGTGLGLSVCYGIITDHNGRIYAESEKGKGATFIVELPIVSEESQLALAEPEAEEPEKVTGAKILVVDDELGVRKFLSRLLVEEGYDVDTVDNAGDALERIEKERYNLILLDIKMPDMSGIELYQRIRKIARSLTKRVVFITGDAMAADTKSFLSRSKASYISKPFDTKQLKKEINRILTEG